MRNPAPRASTPDIVSAKTTTLDDLDQALLRIHSYADIRLFIAGTANFGHQASSVDLLLRLVDDYAYAGLITVVYDEGNPGCGINLDKLPRLLRRYMDRCCRAECTLRRCNGSRCRILQIQTRIRIQLPPAADW